MIHKEVMKAIENIIEKAKPYIYKSDIDPSKKAKEIHDSNMVSMNYKEVIKAIRDLFKEAGLDTLENDIKLIYEEINITHGVSYNSRKSYSQITTSIENEIQDAKLDGLFDLIEDKRRKQKLNLHIPLSFIRDITHDDSIEYPEMVKAIVITYFEIQNGTNRTKALKRLKSSLSRTLERLQNKSKREAEEIVKAISFAYFKDQADSFKNRSKKPSTAIYTDYGYILNLT